MNACIQADICHDLYGEVTTWAKHKLWNSGFANGVLNSYRNLKNNMEAFQHERKSNSCVFRWSWYYRNYSLVKRELRLWSCLRMYRLRTGRRTRRPWRKSKILRSWEVIHSRCNRWILWWLYSSLCTGPCRLREQIFTWNLYGKTADCQEVSGNCT